VKIWLKLLLALLALIVVAAAVGMWFVFRRPLTVYAWLGKRALARAGLVRVVTDSRVGRQNVWRGGSGPFVMLLHGAGDQAATWSRVVPETLAGHTLLIPDLAGHGESEPSRGPITMEAMLTGVEAVLDAQAGEEHVTVVGNSLGAWIAMLLAHGHPERVSLVVAVNGGAARGEEQHISLLPNDREQARALVALLRDPASVPAPNFVLDDIVRHSRTGPLARVAAAAEAMNPYLLDGRLGEIRVPVRLVWGESDRVVPLDYAQRMLAELRDASLTVVPRCGHVPQAECPAAFLAALIPHLEGRQ
jgi:pimeloyl-ACP methyl ester carboxylesterase